MPVRIRGDFVNIKARLTQAGGQIRRAVSDGMELEAKEIQRLAKAFVPVDAGNMENAIKVENYDRRRRWAVYVDKTERDDTGKFTVGDYLTFLHERMDYKLGEKSRMKDGGSGNVGSKFLERAYRQVVATGALRRIRDKAREVGVLR